MKKEYLEPELDVVFFEDIDVLISTGLEGADDEGDDYILPIVH